MSIYTKFLNELAVARSGDYDFGNLNYIGNGETLISDRFFNRLTTFTYNEKELSIGIYKGNTNPTYYLLTEKVYDTETESYRNKVITAMDLEMVSSKTHKEYKNFPYTNMAIVRGVETLKSERGKGYGFQLYKHLVNDLHFTIVGDLEQYEGARNLWKLLSKNSNFMVDIIDLNTGNIIEKNVTITDALDSRVWTDEVKMFVGSDKEIEIGRFRRLVLTKVN